MAPGVDVSAVEAEYPFLTNDYYLRLIDPAAGTADPIYRQSFPAPEELADRSSSFDPLAENEQMPTPRLIHRFRDRVVLLTTGKCAMRCRFCFRKRTWKQGADFPDLTASELKRATEYLTAHPEIREVLVSGGDPLMLGKSRLREILTALAAVPSIEILRVGSRIPVVAPELLDEEYAALLGSFPGLWFATHFNHPRELTPEARAACTRLIRAGVPVVNQTVLLKGVNDDAGVLEELFRTLVSWKVKPHYLFHVDPVRGVRHFATGIASGLEILRAFRPRLSSLATPTFAIDLPEGGGKVALQPEYGRDGRYLDLHERKLIAYGEFNSPID